MSKDKFPYSEQDFDDEDHYKLASMLKWSWKNTNARLKEHNDRLENHNDRIGDVETEIQLLDKRKSIVKEQRNKWISIVGAIGSVVMIVLAFFKFLL